MRKIINGLKEYLTDWKNLLAHAIIGVGILAVAIFLPVKPVYRVGILVVIVVINILRMRWEKANKK